MVEHEAFWPLVLHCPNLNPIHHVHEDEDEDWDGDEVGDDSSGHGDGDGDGDGDGGYGRCCRRVSKAGMYEEGGHGDHTSCHTGSDYSTSLCTATKG